MLVLPSQKAVVPSPAAVLAHLREKIDRLEGVQCRFANTAPVCDIIDAALPYRGLPLGCVHELKGANIASSIAFASLLSARIPRKGAILYVAPDRSFYPLGLLCGDVKLEQWIHVSVRRSKDLAWTVLEALRCPAVMAVLAVIKAADLTFCRRLQLAAESSGATGFLLNDAASSPVASAITRWRISSIKGPSGRGFGEVFWKLELLYCRGGRPGKWPIVWRHGRLEPLGPFTEIPTRSIHRIELASETTLAG
jgi:protein ImuA